MGAVSNESSRIGGPTPQQLERAHLDQLTRGGTLTQSLVRLGSFTELELQAQLAERVQMPFVDLSTLELDAEVVSLVPRSVAARHGLIAIHRVDSALVVALADPTNMQALDDVRLATGLNIEVVVATASQIQASIEATYT